MVSRVRGSCGGPTIRAQQKCVPCQYRFAGRYGGVVSTLFRSDQGRTHELNGMVIAINSWCVPHPRTMTDRGAQGSSVLSLAPGR